VTDLLELADRLWRGAVDTTQVHPFSHFNELAEPAAGTGFVASFANVSALRTDDGLVLVDTGSALLSGSAHDTIRRWTGDPAHTVVFTHGHIDHCFGVERYDADNAERGAPPPVVVAHEAVPDRFDRYRATVGYNTVINRRQFSLAGGQFVWPEEYRYPDRTYRDRLDLDIGGERVELHHARGETDDHTWAWVPARGVLFSGDLFIWASPNCGNPQKVQRYPGDWAAALRTMAALGATTLLPGHGLPVVGSDRVRQALTDTAALLEHLLGATLELMNAGAPLDEIIHTVRAPADLLERPYLRPVYDEPEFVVRNVWRLYGGWYDGNPSRLKPAPDRDVAAEVATLAGGPGRLAERALELADAGDLRLAAHVVEWAALAAPADRVVQRARADVYERRVADATSTMAKGVFGWAARESRAASDD
jgi:glyoxylase-like metal-dependent hydrolase (beta-lactamase superfamily II)